MFIRAPGILEVGPDVEVLADIPVESSKSITIDADVQAQQVCLHRLHLSLSSESDNVTVLCNFV